MRIAICHFHLQTGGVTRVIEHAATALVSNGHQVLVIAGEPPQQSLPEGTSFALAPALAYEERRPAAGPKELAADLERSAREHLGQLPDLWHVHNHCLGKNLAVPGALIVLAERGQHLLLQPHDFAEDGRPGLYARLLEHLGGGDATHLSAQLYPLAAHLHYAVLNGRDRSFLGAAGIPPERLHLLPNAVSLPTPAERTDGPYLDHRLWLFPTRAIRRKNLGELLLWSTLAEEQDLFAATQAPQNPVEQARYKRWVALAAELNLPVEFELGNRVDDFPTLLASAEALVTTSVAEGFGLAFLEPWLAGRPLVGRDLPEITRDFSAAGLDLGGLYERLDVPLEWLDRKRLLAAMQSALSDVMAAYGRGETSADQERLWSSAVRNGFIDFGRLDETAQEEVIRHLAADTGEGASPLRPPRLAETVRGDLIAHNRCVADREFSIDGYGRRLEGIYRSLLDSPVDSKLDFADGSILLDRFLAPERLFLLRT
jgi:glycosyltransferase involved in cell wall biosynthesis